ncbi:hypothetical protein BDY17DRAFT_245977 [Neohortaea acidophila]|uniref:CAP-Gly domain-containing protein n=1 Tax=Neohortaea acidophila TaxID=245834 RepID=A0A6A6Q4L9_9PEZI|nr:uncharacterized protein BDY17DRAFT_245977 [Neohortaea acidophila]KAF2486934.1 hypothetical protein BDY17DRAFT_245977 [Neohortaea acidophila]
MTTPEYYVGQRLSLKGQACTVQYLGTVGDKAGSWLGVEWDDPARGKHDGTFAGVRYFHCRSKSPTAASFVKPAQSWDAPRSFLTALKDKYMPDYHADQAQIVYISGKQAEEVGFEKFSQRQSRLHGVHVLVLDRMRIKHAFQSDEEKSAIQHLCADITELDLSGNLFEAFQEVLVLCKLFPKLRTLTLDSNRFAVGGSYGDSGHGTLSVIATVKYLSLATTLFSPKDRDGIISRFPKLETLVLTANEISGPLHLQTPPHLSTLDLSDNELISLSDLRHLQNPHLHTILLRRNRIQTVTTEAEPAFALSVTEIDLTYNAVDTWLFFNSITKHTFPNLTHLRVTGNSLYQHLVSAEGKPLTSEDGYMLTLARLPQLQFLNYAKITEKERLNAETYYLGQIAAELSLASEEAEAGILAKHPRYRELCEEYGEPSIQRRSKANGQVEPNSLAARLVAVTFILAASEMPQISERHWTEEVPKTFNIYALLGTVGKRLGVMPLDLNLILETNERDPAGRNDARGAPEWWDSSDDEEAAAAGAEGEWIKRETVLVPGTRTLGTYVDGREATVRVEERRG